MARTGKVDFIVGGLAWRAVLRDSLSAAERTDSVADGVLWRDHLLNLFGDF